MFFFLEGGWYVFLNAICLSATSATGGQKGNGQLPDFTVLEGVGVCRGEILLIQYLTADAILEHSLNIFPDYNCLYLINIFIVMLIKVCNQEMLI